MEPAIPEHSKRITAEEYLRLEEASDAKHEFRHGEIIDMAGGGLSSIPQSPQI